MFSAYFGDLQPQKTVSNHHSYLSTSEFPFELVIHCIKWWNELSELYTRKKFCCSEVTQRPYRLEFWCLKPQPTLPNFLSHNFAPTNPNAQEGRSLMRGKRAGQLLHSQKPIRDKQGRSRLPWFTMSLCDSSHIARSLKFESWKRDKRHVDSD